MATSSTLSPVGKGERIHALDALRGFAILGIFVINIRVFSGYSFMMDDLKNSLLLADWNAAFDWLHTLLFAGKFYTLFSLLFGIGFAIQFIRASSTDRSFTLHFSRRLFFLLMIGIVHLWGIWFSDILVIYALCGYVIILFSRFPNMALLGTAFLVLLLPGAHAWYLNAYEHVYTDYLYTLLSEAWNFMELPKASEDQYTFQMRDLVEVIQSESWSTVFSFNFIGPVLRAYMLALDARILKVLGVFIIGIYLGRHLMLHKLHENKSALIKIAFTGLIIGLPLNMFIAMDNATGLEQSSILLLKDTLTPFAYVSLTMGYVGAFFWLYRSGFQKTFNLLFSAVGKTALSNYIFQSILGILLFYDVGLGLGNYFGAAALTIATILIFGFQIIVSILWLKRYRFGPLEWLWRMLTYGRYMTNKKSSRT
ncbi:MAG: DUF418 domain-containing protein [Cyclonatronaceae bacterium]